MIFNEFLVIYLFIFAPLFRKDKHFRENRLKKGPIHEVYRPLQFETKPT